MINFTNSAVYEMAVVPLFEFKSPVSFNRYSGSLILEPYASKHREK